MHSIFNGRAGDASRNQYTICLERMCARSYSSRGRSATEVKSRLDSATYRTHRGRKQTIRKGVGVCSKRKVVRFGLCCFVDGCFQALCKCIVCRAHPVKTIFKSTRSSATGDWIAGDIQGIAISLETAGLETSFQWNRAEIADDDICFDFSNFIPRKIWGSLIAKSAYVYH